ncbi:hypothetical protein R3P38DRAFT_2981525 [Favolaschia claudopus]|uniref:Uncharacterized protein n=1 Tax=Favolaschia claudopus TaxID=2862362 RepID=A0AAW0AYB7_9AGAR
MEAFFDNKTNILNTRICAKLDASELYTVETKLGVGAINWKEKTFEVRGEKRKYHELRRTKGNLFNKTRAWRWSAMRKEYDLSYSFEEWKAVLDDGVTVAGTFSAPFRPRLFHKFEAPVINLSSTALFEDEVFLLLVFIYEEVKRQDKTASVHLVF